MASSPDYSPFHVCFYIVLNMAHFSKNLHITALDDNFISFTFEA